MNDNEIITIANEILKQTENNQKEYSEERILIFKQLENYNNINLEMLDLLIKIYEKEKKMKEENEKYHIKKIASLKKSLQRQKVRADDEIDTERIIIFSIEDKNMNKYSFLNRKNAQKYIEEHKDKFEIDTTITLCINDNIDIEEILKK